MIIALSSFAAWWDQKSGKAIKIANHIHPHCFATNTKAIETIVTRSVNHMLIQVFFFGASVIYARGYNE
jgi:hypothetical protein